MGLTVTIYNFIYIAVIVLGGVTLPLTLILQIKERDKYHRALMLFVGAIFIYMIADFVTYYFMSETVSANWNFALITISDVLFCVLTLAWMYLIQVFVGTEHIVKLRYLIILTVTYAAISQILSISLGRYNTYSMYLVVESGMGSVFLQWTNVAYVVSVIIICLWDAFYVLKNTESRKIQRPKLLLIMSLVIYMIYVAMWDYVIWFKTEAKLIDIYALDPMLLLYAFISATVIFYFYKKDPLKLSGSQVAAEDAVKVIVRRYGLTGREAEILTLINMGKSNMQIAAELSISENTVKRHVNSIFKKTETQSRHEIIFKISNVHEIDL